MREKLYSGNHSEIAQSLSDLAISYGWLGDDNKAFEYIKKALERRGKLYSGNINICVAYFLNFFRGIFTIYRLI